MIHGIKWLLGIAAEAEQIIKFGILSLAGFR
jgi:hypothetical protein